MNEEISLSRLRVSRRRALAIGGTVSLGGLLAACGGDDDGSGTSAAKTTSTPTSTNAEGKPDVLALLDQAPDCVMSAEQTQGPYWFDVDSIRDDIREKRPGTRLDLALRVQDLSECKRGGEAAPVPNAVVEIWHCDAGGVYSGFESSSTGGPGGGGGGAPPAGGPPPGGGAPGGGASASGGDTSNGSYSVGDQEADPTDDGTYLRGAQPTGRDGIASFTTIYPGWYQGRTVHIHVKVHIDKKTVVTSQLFFDEKVNAVVFRTSPYDERTGRDTFNDDDNIFDESGLIATSKAGDGYLGAINLGVNT